MCDSSHCIHAERAHNAVDVIKCIYNLNFMKWKIKDCLKSSHPFVICFCCFFFHFCLFEWFAVSVKIRLFFICWLFYHFQCKFINSNSKIWFLFFLFIFCFFKRELNVFTNTTTLLNESRTYTQRQTNKKHINFLPHQGRIIITSSNISLLVNGFAIFFSWPLLLPSKITFYTIRIAYVCVCVCLNGLKFKN